MHIERPETNQVVEGVLNLVNSAVAKNYTQPLRFSTRAYSKYVVEEALEYLSNIRGLDVSLEGSDVVINI